MSLITLLRILIAAEIVFAVGGVLLELLLESTLPQPLRAYLTAQSEAPLAWKDLLAVALAVPLLVATIVAWITTLAFWRFAPALYLASHVAGVLLLPFLGPTVQTAVGTALDTAMNLIGGIVIGLLYFSELTHRYSRHPPTASHAPARRPEAPLR